MIWFNRLDKSVLELSCDDYVYNVDYTTKDGKDNFTKPFCRKGNALNFCERFIKKFADKITSPSATSAEGVKWLNAIFEKWKTKRKF